MSYRHFSYNFEEINKPKWPSGVTKHEQDLDIDLGLDVLGNLDIDLVSKSILYQYKTKIRKKNLRKKI